MSPDLAIYGLHGAFWGAFGLTRIVLDAAAPEPATAAPVVEKLATAPFSRALLLVHLFAFGALYFGLGNAVIPDRVPDLFPGQRIAGALVMTSGAALACWALVSFRSWRIRAKLDAGHQLATGGPFARIRNPIYMALNLFALGTALWCPTPIVWIGFALMLIGSDLRARAEEKILEEGFGDAYRQYRARTSRFIPGIY